MSLKNKLLGIALTASLALTAFTDADAATRDEIAAISVKANGSDFKYWTKDAKALNALKSYIKDVTDKNSANFIPKEDRIAVFDMDGTILCETAPIYFDHSFFMHRVFDDPSFKPTKEQYETAKNVEAKAKHIGAPYPSANTAKVAVSAFTDMTDKEFEKKAKEYMKENVTGLTNLKWGEAFYLPMIEVISYLAHNDFKVYVVSGSERQICRALIVGIMDIPTNQIIGTDIVYKAEHQGDKAALDYIYQKDDKLLRGEFIIKDLQMNKVSAINREIGKQPVLAFGNSMSDASMMNFAITGNKYKTLAFGVICDDREREMGSPKTEAVMLQGCRDYGWIPISMKNDFKTIYGDNVKLQK
ncbi:MAG: haloacid dehalogenase-like hydrolase [Selenomonadaceae bacterium]|nr:haloacid dehalogenase-like hydrolase [Selenomonadaceae bacterium]